MLYKRKLISQLPNEGKYYPPGAKSIDDGQTFIKDERKFNREVASVITEIKTTDGTVTANVGDSILIDNTTGEQWVCRANNFIDMFEVDES